MKIKGIWLPIVTPFKDDKVDLKSYEKLVKYYINEGIDGIMPVATTGEVPTLSEEEYETVLAKTMELTDGKIGVFAGLGGYNTKALISKLKLVEKYKVDGILSVSPYYNRPDQRGIYEHFNAISESTDLDIVLYNIPYRTGRNIENETLFKLAEKKNIIGVKDASGDFNKTIELLLNRPEDFCVLSGEDAFFYNALLLGGDGGIMASAHLRTKDFIKVYNDIQNNDYKEALKTWRELGKIVPMLFKEPNPTPIKYILEQKGLIDSAEVRLPLVEITDELKKELQFLI
ncbi:4-hydroxy-tetrahydrodipicolinate synthase [Clostridium sp. SHJSY1]|uniref:4-hydroxy-tetrahydrodipicolinate synthase n=1 Tax=Clostridium sp. SHJSY1 TaxID=2942483 RepID=UPI0028757703|nr:4-hydroxy-tetrahydrodipicolinate synthase [Clostridium sp. SHJSY1]MDS0524501.1 4-hydroxy-tetrahydrodipicolinate synthase [Clostridium sp. SHJSY1]